MIDKRQPHLHSMTLFGVSWVTLTSDENTGCLTVTLGGEAPYTDTSIYVFGAANDGVLPKVSVATVREVTNASD